MLIKSDKTITKIIYTELAVPAGLKACQILWITLFVDNCVSAYSGTYTQLP